MQHPTIPQALAHPMDGVQENGLVDTPVSDDIGTEATADRPLAHLLQLELLPVRKEERERQARAQAMQARFALD